MDSHAYEANALLANFGTAVFHTCGNQHTAQVGCDLLGKRKKVFVSTSSPSGEPSVWGEIMGRRPWSFSAREEYTPILQSTDFLSGMRHGGPPHFVVDAIMIRTGTPFKGGENYIFTYFHQR